MTRSTEESDPTSVGLLLFWAAQDFARLYTQCVDVTSATSGSGATAEQLNQLVSHCQAALSSVSPTSFPSAYHRLEIYTAAYVKARVAAGTLAASGPLTTVPAR